MPVALDIWLKAHPDHADAAFAGPIADRLRGIRDRLAARGYTLKLDIGKRTTKAIVTSKSLRSTSTYPSLGDFIAFEEGRLAEMESA